VFPFEEPLEVREGDSLRMDMEVVHGPGSDGLLFRWGIEGPAGGRESSSVNAIPPAGLPGKRAPTRPHHARRTACAPGGRRRPASGRNRQVGV
jgi:hypothetical protein